MKSSNEEKANLVESDEIEMNWRRWINQRKWSTGIKLEMGFIWFKGFELFWIKNSGFDRFMKRLGFLRITAAMVSNEFEQFQQTYAFNFICCFENHVWVLYHLLFPKSCFPLMLSVFRYLSVDLWYFQPLAVEYEVTILLDCWFQYEPLPKLANLLIENGFGSLEFRLVVAEGRIIYIRMWLSYGKGFWCLSDLVRQLEMLVMKLLMRKSVKSCNRSFICIWFLCWKWMICIWFLCWIEIEDCQSLNMATN